MRKMRLLILLILVLLFVTNACFGEIVLALEDGLAGIDNSSADAASTGSNNQPGSATSNQDISNPGNTAPVDSGNQPGNVSSNQDVPSPGDTVPADSGNQPGNISSNQDVPGSGDTVPADSDNQSGNTSGNTPSNQYIPVADLDIADVQNPMVIGTSQLLSVTVIPADATEHTITYKSQTPEIASVNALGRVTALAVGTATIQIVAAEQTRFISIVVEADPAKTVVQVTDIDVDYEDTMTVDATQQLFPTVLPAEATEKIRYSSANSNIAEINAFGKITAVSRGTATITLSADNVSKSITITVKDKIVPTDIDFDVPDTKITVGSTMTIGAVVLPTDAIDQDIAYSTSNESILTVNGFGRVKGISVGTATVTMQVGNIKKSIAFTVVKEVVVDKIEVNEFKEKMKIDEKQTISVAVYPTEAKEQKITYSSSNPEVAGISEGGNITAVSKGETTITISAGSAVKELKLTVYVATEEIKTADNYLIMQPSSNYRIFATVSPADADQDLIYRSTNEKIAKVSPNGTVTALAPGNASIIISNQDSLKAVTVMVNKGAALFNVADKSNTQVNKRRQNDSQMLVGLIKEAKDGGTIVVNGTEYPLVTTDVLLALYQTTKSVSIVYDDYIVRINGTDIKNAENVLSTQIPLVKTGAGLSFVINDKKNLPGAIEVKFLNLDANYRYLYLLNEATKKYERLNALIGTTAKINLTGAYMLSMTKLNVGSIGVYIFIAAAVFIGVCAVIYTVIRKKYLFW